MGISLLLCDCCELIFGQPHLEHLVLSTCFYQYKLHCRNVISVLRWPDVLSLRGVPRLFEAPGLVPDPPGWSKREAGIHLLPGPGIPRGASVVRVRSF